MNKAQLEKFKTMLDELKTYVNEKNTRNSSLRTLLLITHQLRFFYSSNVNNNVTLHSPPSMQNYVSVIYKRVLCHHRFNNMNGDGHGNGHGPTF
ncbi:hypothetical protein CR513_33951, partial [Mucuna pruriens]